VYFENTLYTYVHHPLPSLITAVCITSGIKCSSLQALPFQRFTLKQMGRIVYFKKAICYANSSIAMGRVTQTEEVSEEDSNKERPTTREYGGRPSA
jgi:hypothetical protein